MCKCRNMWRCTEHSLQQPIICWDYTGRQREGNENAPVDWRRAGRSGPARNHPNVELRAWAQAQLTLR